MSRSTYSGILTLSLLALAPLAAYAQPATITNVKNLNGTAAADINYNTLNAPTTITRSGVTSGTLVSGSGAFHTQNVTGGHAVSGLRNTSMGCASGAVGCTATQWGSVILGGANGRGHLELSWSGGLANGSGFDLFVFENGTVPTGSELYYMSVKSGGVWSEQRYVKPTQMMLNTGGQTQGFLTFFNFDIWGFGAADIIEGVRFTGGRAGDRGTFDASTGSWIVPADYVSGAETMTDAQGNAFTADSYDADMLLVGVLSGPAVTIPEPSTVALFASGIVVLGLAARRRKAGVEKA